MPPVAVQLLDALADERTTATRLARIIESDQALASKVLSLSNSAYYSISQKVTTIERAVVVIGWRELRILSLGASLVSVFDPRRMAVGFDGDGLWRHCLAVSLIARELADTARYPQPNEVLVAGLLHDIGKLITAAFLKEEAEQLTALVKQKMTYTQAEEKLDLRHERIGGLLATSWGLPEMHQEVIRTHHNPLITDAYYTVTCLTAAADNLAHQLGYICAQNNEPAPWDDVLAGSGLTDEQTEVLRPNLPARIDPVLQTWSQMQGN